MPDDGEVWPQSLTMARTRFRKEKLYCHETSELRKRLWRQLAGQATLIRNTKSSFEFKINNLKQHADHDVEAGNFIRCG